MRFILIGRGRMGSLIRQTAEANGDSIAAAFGREDLEGLDRLDASAADAVIDFSQPGALDTVAAYVRRTGTPLLSGVTGYSPEQLEQIRSLGEAAPVMWSANFSLGVAVLYRALRTAAGALGEDFDIEITEAHHGRKADAPSGTAKLLLVAVDPDHALTPVYGREGRTGERTKHEVGVHALRGGTVAGTHTVYFLGPDEELEFTHRAASRQIFVNGALNMVHRLAAMPKGYYDMQTLLFGE